MFLHLFHQLFIIKDVDTNYSSSKIYSDYYFTTYPILVYNNMGILYRVNHFFWFGIGKFHTIEGIWSQKKNY